MSNFHEGCYGRVLFVCLLAGLMCGAVMAQDQPVPRTETYFGYAWQDPGAKFSGIPIGGMSRGFEVQSTFNFNKYLGFTVDTGGSFKDTRANIAYVFAGPTLHLRSEHMSPFFHALIGLHRVNPASGFAGNPQDNNGVGGVLGGGFDLDLSKHFALRVIQADYIWAHHNYFLTGGSSDWQGGRIGGGIVLKLGSLGPPPPPPSASCVAQPTEVMAGEPVQVTASPSGFRANATLTYNWTATGGKVSGTAATTNVDTAGLAPGSYAVTSNITDGKKGAASCNASFTVKEPPPPPSNPPTITCSANPSTVQSGAPSTITATATSPDNRPVTVSYSASGGRISGSGNTATLDTAGAAAGPITVTCTATDDRGLTGSSTTSVNVEVPPPPPTASKLNEIQFPNKLKPARVDNEAKAILDDVALRLQRDTDSKAVVVGYATAAESRRNKNLAAQRAVNTKGYLVSEKGIDPSRIEVRTGTGDGQKAEIWIVPAGASFTEEGTVVVTGNIKAQRR
jgi:outer membrane protein OmpA-like peptidoglycan-associated protein